MLDYETLFLVRLCDSARPPLAYSALPRIQVDFKRGTVQSGRNAGWRGITCRSSRGIEMNPEHVEIAKKRLGLVMEQTEVVEASR